MNTATDWIEAALRSPEFTVAALPAAFVAGLFGAVASCCTLPALGAVAGFSASRGARGKRDGLGASLSFLAGSAAALVAAGLAAGFAGQAVAGLLGRQFKLFAGVVSVLFGTSALGLLPFRLPGIPLPTEPRSAGPWGAAAFGFAIGGASAACTVACNPALTVFLGLAVVGGRPLWGAAVLGTFAAGYSLPLAAILAGLNAGRSALGTDRLAAWIGRAGGAVLLALGFWFLATF